MISDITNCDMTFRENTLYNTVGKVDDILNVTGVPMEENEYKLITLPAPEARDTQTVKLIIFSAETKRRILQNAKHLKSSDAYKNMYVKNDETKLARSDVPRKKARELRNEFPGAVIKIEKGKLTHDGVERDKFDITNQI